MAVLRVGVVGVGGVAGGHMAGIVKSPDMELVAICDTNPKRLKERAAEFNIPADHCFKNYQDLIDCPDVDVVDIATPNHVHCEIAAAAAKAGKPYGVEKPVGNTVEEVVALAEVTHQMGVESMIHFTYRYKAAARRLREIFQSGKLGKIHHVHMKYYQSWGREACDTPLLWRYQKAITGSGALGDLGCHALDLVSFATGLQYEKVSAHLGTIVTERCKMDNSGMGPVDVDDFAHIHAVMTGGVAATFQITRFAYGRGNYQILEVYGENGGLEYTLDREGRDVDELRICTAETNGEWVIEEIPDEKRVDKMQQMAYVMMGQGDGLNADIDAGVVNQKLLNGIIESSETGQWVDVR